MHDFYFSDAMLNRVNKNNSIIACRIFFFSLILKKDGGRSLWMWK